MKIQNKLRDDIYPSKRVKNHAAKKLRVIFGIKGRVILKHADSIFHTGDRCYGLHFVDNDSKGRFIHWIIIAEDANQDMQTYMSTLMHEYIHAWQAENGYSLDHGKEFKIWKKLLDMRYRVNI